MAKIKKQSKSLVIFEAMIVVLIVGLISFLGFGYSSNQQRVANQKPTDSSKDGVTPAKPVEAVSIPAIANSSDVDDADASLDSVLDEIETTTEDDTIIEDLEALESGNTPRSLPKPKDK